MAQPRDGILFYKDGTEVYRSYPSEHTTSGIEVSRDVLTNNRESFMLSVFNARFEDAGVYMCKLKNYGRRKEACIITVIDIGMPIYFVSTCIPFI